MSVRQMPDVPASGMPQFAGSGIASGGSGGGGGGNSASKDDIVTLQIMGTTNSTGSTITAGTWFYLNGKLCVAKVDIASNATFTLNTNYEEKTVGSALSELNGNITIKYYTVDVSRADGNSQLGYYGFVDITNDIALYGQPIGCSAYDKNGYIAISGTGSDNPQSAMNLVVDSKHSGETKLAWVAYSKNATTIPLV